MAAQRKSGGGSGGGGGAKVGTPKGRGSSDIRLPGEKAVRGTSKSVSVKPPSDTPGGPSDPAAVDQRRQIVGTDDPGGRSEKRRGGRGG
jgi:hypothetical protein